MRVPRTDVRCFECIDHDDITKVTDDLYILPVQCLHYFSSDFLPSTYGFYSSFLDVF